INTIKKDQSQTVAAFIEKALDTGVLSHKNVDEYIEDIFNNEELMNSAILFAVAPDLNKYQEGFDEYRTALTDWAKPLQNVKFYGTIEDTVENILYDEEIYDMVTWFIPDETINEYVGTVDTYFQTYKEAKWSLNTLGVSLSEGDYELAVNQVINDKDIYNLLTTIFPSDTVDVYLAETEMYYDMYREYYALYTEYLTAFEEAVQTISTDEMNEYVDLVLDYAYNDTVESREMLLDIVTSIDVEQIQEVIGYIEKDSGLIKEHLDNIDPYYYDEFKAYVNGLHETKAFILDSIQSTDVDAILEAAKIIDHLNEDITYVINLLQEKDYEKVFEVITNNQIRIYEATEFIQEQTEDV
ncbi:MAG: hypothetical protein MJE63_04100, partial [Proteobacteria bacterium]|nr:hypothetical protein [Pseudomonadota bacterium]